MSCLVIIPTYNEEENIDAIIDEVLKQDVDFHVLVVDDNSKDSTAFIVKDKIKKYGGVVFILQRLSKLGLGSAYIEGFRWAINRNYSYVAEMDADFSHPVATLCQFIYELKYNNVDVVIGSRYVKGGSVKNWSYYRKAISKLGSLYSRMLTGIPVHDTTAGFIAYKTEVLRRINLDVFAMQGYVFQIEMKLAAWVLGFRIKEIPICFTDRVLGSSKMNSSIIFEAMLHILKLACFIRTGIYKNKIVRINRLNIK